MSRALHKRVLVLEEDGDLRRMLGSLLRQNGLDIDEAAGGREALDLLRERTYDVILLDLLMPEPDGFAVLEELERIIVSTGPVVLVVSDPAVTEDLDSRWVHGIVRKPFDPDEVASLVLACAQIRSRGPISMMAVAMISSVGLLEML